MDGDYTRTGHSNKVWTFHTFSLSFVAGSVVVDSEHVKRVVAESVVAHSVNVVIVVADSEHDCNATAILVKLAEVLNFIGGHNDPNQSQKSHHACLLQA